MTLHITILNNKLYIISRNNPTACVICWIDFFKQQLFLIYIFRLSKKQVKPQFHWVWSLLKLVTTLLTTINQTTRSDLWPCSCYTWNHFNGNHTPPYSISWTCSIYVQTPRSKPSTIQHPYSPPIYISLNCHPQNCAIRSTCDGARAPMCSCGDDWSFEIMLNDFYFQKHLTLCGAPKYARIRSCLMVIWLPFTPWPSFRSFGKVKAAKTMFTSLWLRSNGWRGQCVCALEIGRRRQNFT